jgi:hypothetical protein
VTLQQAVGAVAQSPARLAAHLVLSQTVARETRAREAAVKVEAVLGTKAFLAFVTVLTERVVGADVYVALETEALYPHRFSRVGSHNNLAALTASRKLASLKQEGVVLLTSPCVAVKCITILAITAVGTGTSVIAKLIAVMRVLDTLVNRQAAVSVVLQPVAGRTATLVTAVGVGTAALARLVINTFILIDTVVALFLEAIRTR